MHATQRRPHPYLSQSYQSLPPSPSTTACTNILSTLISKWPTSSTIYRQRLLHALAQNLPKAQPHAFVQLSLLVLHTVARLLSFDTAPNPPSPSPSPSSSASTPPTTSTTQHAASISSLHPRYTEPLLHELLSTLHVALTPHHVLQPPSPITLSPSPGTPPVNKSPTTNPHIPYLFLLRRAVQAAPADPHHYSIAFVLSTVAAIPQLERGAALKVQAIRVVCALMAVLPKGLLAAFVPGVASALFAVVSKGGRVHSAVGVLVLQAVHQIVVRTFPRGGEGVEKGGGEGGGEGGEVLSLADTLRNLSVQSRRRADHEAEKEVTSDTQATNNISSNRSNNSDSKKSLLVTIDANWLSATSKQLTARLTLLLRSHMTLRNHSRTTARLALANFLSRHLRDTRRHGLLSDGDARALCKMVLVEACASPYEGIVRVARAGVVGCGGVRGVEGALRAVLEFGGFYGGGVDGGGRVADDVRRDMEALRVLKEGGEDDFEMVVCAGLLAVIVPADGQVGDGEDSADVEEGEEDDAEGVNGDEVVFRDDVEDDSGDEGDEEDGSVSYGDVVPLERLPAFVNRVGVSAFAKMLTALHESHWKPTRVARDAVADAMGNRVLEAGRRMGSMGLLSCVYDSLLGMASGGEEGGDGGIVSGGDNGEGRGSDLRFFKRRAHAALVLQAVVRGAMVVGDDGGVDDGRAAQVFACAREVVEVMSGMFVPDMAVASDEEVRVIDDAVLTLKLGLLKGVSCTVCELAEFQRRCGKRPIGSDVVLVCIMDLLRDAAHGEMGGRPAGKDVLESLAKVTRCESVRGLLLRHINFVLGRVIRNLHQAWAGDVLRFVIGDEADDISREATILLLRTLKGLSDGLAGCSDGRAMQTLASMRSVLQTAVSQRGLGLAGVDVEEGVISPKSDGGVDREVAMVQRAIMSVCTEDVADGDLPAEVEEDGMKNDQFDGFAEEKDEKNPFDDIAESVLDGARDLLVGRDWGIRAAALECTELAVRLLKNRKKLLLPHVAKLLPLLPEQFACMDEELNAGDRMRMVMRERKMARGRISEEVEEVVRMVNGKGAELPVVRQACRVLCALAECAGSFVRERFVRLVYPRMRPLLRLCEWFPTLVSGSGVEGIGGGGGGVGSGLLPSYGAMAACDACMEALAAMAVRVPVAVVPFAGMVTGYVAVFFDERWRPGAGGGGRAARVNMSMVRFEGERWERRVLWAERMVRALGAVRGDEVFTALLCGDREAPAVLRNENDERLVDIVVR